MKYKGLRKLNKALVRLDRIIKKDIQRSLGIEADKILHESHRYDEYLSYMYTISKLKDRI